MFSSWTHSFASTILAVVLAVLSVCCSPVIVRAQTALQPAVVSITLYNDTNCTVPYSTSVYNLASLSSPGVGSGGYACLNSSVPQVAAAGWSNVQALYQFAGNVQQLTVHYWPANTNCDLGAGPLSAVSLVEPVSAPGTCVRGSMYGIDAYGNDTGSIVVGGRFAVITSPNAAASASVTTSLAALVIAVVVVLTL